MYLCLVKTNSLCHLENYYIFGLSLDRHGDPLAGGCFGLSQDAECFLKCFLTRIHDCDVQTHSSQRQGQMPVWFLDILSVKR